MRHRKKIRVAGAMAVIGRVVAGVALVSALGAGRAYAWPWSTDMAKQPSIKPQAAPRPSPAETVPVQGKEPALDRVEAGKKLSNPVAATPAALADGKRLFQTYCAPCHGPAAKGDGLVAKKFIPPPDLTLEAFRRRPDGFIYETIKSGGPIMPSQGEALLPRERWEIVLYLRSLQSQ